MRRELADNFCYYNPHYDSVQGFSQLGAGDLGNMRTIQSEYLYSIKELEEAKTHDELWNAAQMEMVCRGRCTMQRMYWAKKI